MENIFVTLLPKQKENKTYFTLSYFKQEGHLYKDLGEQHRLRNNLKSDITMLIVAQVIQNTVGNIFSGQVAGKRPKTFPNVLGRYCRKGKV
jgi:hypothetical protein